ASPDAIAPVAVTTTDPAPPADPAPPVDAADPPPATDPAATDPAPRGGPPPTHDGWWRRRQPTRRRRPRRRHATPRPTKVDAGAPSGSTRTRVLATPAPVEATTAAKARRPPRRTRQGRRRAGEASPTGLRAPLRLAPDLAFGAGRRLDVAGERAGLLQRIRGLRKERPEDLEVMGRDGVQLEPGVDAVAPGPLGESLGILDHHVADATLDEHGGQPGQIAVQGADQRVVDGVPVEVGGDEAPELLQGERRLGLAGELVDVLEGEVDAGA